MGVLGNGEDTSELLSLFLEYLQLDARVSQLVLTKQADGQYLNWSEEGWLSSTKKYMDTFEG